MINFGKLLFFLLLFYFSQGGIPVVKAEQVSLPQPSVKGKVSLEEAISRRRSQREFLDKGLGLGEISQLLWSAQGVTGRKSGYNFRAAPSAGALYPMEIYLLTKEGLFHYLPEKHLLEAGLKKDLRKDLAQAALGQTAVSEAPLSIVICALFSRITQKYGQRGMQYVYIEAGHIAENIHLQAVALGLGSVSVGAFDEEKVKKILALPVEYAPLYIIPVGLPRK